MFQLFIFGAGNSANAIEEGYGSVSGAITSENDGEYGLESGSEMGITLGSGTGRDGKKYSLSRYGNIFAFLTQLLSNLKLELKYYFNCFRVL